MKPAIEIQNLGKEYQRVNRQPYSSLREVLAGSIKNIIKPTEKEQQHFWALRNINLDIMPGDRVGIVGQNGAGKSTLLKIISRITTPSTGQAIIRGRVGSLLEVGTGFHPELTGRENIYLNGSILGLKKSEITRQFDAIVDFSGVEKFIDTPLKHYSSGMQMRLAFSVAAHLESEILLIDEVLAVGDTAFQKKCIGKMEKISKEEGRTILFVSHNMSAISTLTTKSVLLADGEVKMVGPTNKVLSAYMQSTSAESHYTNEPVEGRPTITRIGLQTSEEGNLQGYGKPLSIVFDIHMPEADQENIALAFQVINVLHDVPVLHEWLFDSERTSFRKKGINRVKITFPEIKLYRGDYFLRVHLAETRTKNKYEQVDNCFFRVEILDTTEPEWGWYDNMCLYLDRGRWELND